MPSDQFRMILAEMQAIHNKKNKDYSQEGNPFSNFERAAMLASWFDDPVDKVFATLLGVKLARMAELLNGKTPNNESLSDSFLDHEVYSVIWHAWFLERRVPIEMSLKSIEVNQEKITHYNEMTGEVKRGRT